MSADLYTSEIDSDVYGDLFLEMKVGGNLRIITQDPKSRKPRIAIPVILPFLPHQKVGKKPRI